MIQLKLDTNAVLSLFPEGSTARVDLQSAIIKNVVNSVVGKRVSEEINKRIQEQLAVLMPNSSEITQIIKSEFSDYVEKRYGYSNVFDVNYGNVRELSGKIKESVKQQCQTILKDIEKEAIAHATENIIADEAAFIARVSNNLEVTVRKAVMQRVNTQFPDIIDEAIRERLFGEKA
ncbi:hypothetical protein BL02_254 [Klebsiella phage BL02]|jgi:hypothetical protein|uniref:Uncharacterized protein n=1 Tax=Klebsiella phage K14-2 TaxID=3156075 RepID=A0AB39C9G4_9VIRU|nr:hypothetical protein [Klebsiella phage vB_KpnM-VAC66]UJP30404.1 hypothetical protein phKl59_47 [Raoultella phage Rpl1]URQ04507.1 hypothetical protein BL02_254 [Klebsiella phage BL02]UUG67117.1 hypothetical protein 2DI_00236 [Klebsiella phage PSKm2DI]UUG67386.1 hypothetical protein 4DII_00235 [Klebsiella phage PSKm4DII]UYL05714.1 hypothetical protein PMMJPKLI_00174 [Klebsiella phage KP13MC5-1]WMX17979.1 hypothetical protein [Klebsiella phage KpF2]WNA08972.1 hypothetical protein [Klebsiella